MRHLDPGHPVVDGRRPGLTADEKRLFARQMETFAGFAEHTDHEVGRLVEAIRALGELDETPVTEEYKERENRFTGRIHAVTVEVK